MDKSRDGDMRLSITALLICGGKCNVLFIADSRSGKENENALIVPILKMNQKIK